jgi:hypothetical protein
MRGGQKRWTQDGEGGGKPSCLLFFWVAVRFGFCGFCKASHGHSIAYGKAGVRTKHIRHPDRRWDGK